MNHKGQEMTLQLLPNNILTTDANDRSKEDLEDAAKEGGKMLQCCEVTICSDRMDTSL